MSDEKADEFIISSAELLRHDVSTEPLPRYKFSGQVISQKCRIAAAQYRFSRIRQMAPICTAPNTMRPCAHPSTYPKRHLDRFLCSSRQKVPILTMGRPFPPQNCSCAWGSGPPSNTWFHWTRPIPESTTQKSSRLVQRVLQGSRS